MCHGLRTGASSAYSALALKPYSESRVLPEGRGADQAEHPGDVAVLGGRAGHEGVRPVLGREAGDVAVVLDEGGHPGEVAGGRLPGLAPRLVEAVGGQPGELRVETAGALDGRLHHLAARDPTRAELLDQPDGVVVPEGVVTEGMDPS